MKNSLFIVALLLFANCNRNKSITTCGIKTKILTRNHLYVRIINPYRLLNESSVSDKCSFYEAVELGTTDTFYLIDFRPEIDGKNLQHFIKDSVKLIFFPINMDSCITCSFKYTANLDTLKVNTYVVGNLSAYIRW